MPHPNLETEDWNSPKIKIGVVLNLGDFKYSLWKMHIANSGFGLFGDFMV